MDVEKIPDESFYVIIIEDGEADEKEAAVDNSVHRKKEDDCPSEAELSSVQALKNEEDLDNISNVKRELDDIFYGDIEFQNLDDADQTQLLYNIFEDQKFLSQERFEDEQNSENEHYSFTKEYGSSEEDYELTDEKTDEDFEPFDYKLDNDSQSADEKVKIYGKRKLKKGHSIVSDIYKENPELCSNKDALIQILVQIMHSQKPCKLPRNSYIALGSGEHIDYNVHESKKNIQNSIIFDNLTPQKLISGTGIDQNLDDFPDPPDWHHPYFIQKIPYFGLSPVAGCSRCAKTFDSLVSCGRHYQESHGRKYLKCLACSRAYRSKWALYRHEKLCRAPHAPLVLQARGYFLGRKGRNRPFLQSQLPFVLNRNEDPNSNSLSCSMCTARFQSKVALQSHERSHRGERPFQCKLCVRAYTSVSALMRHQNCHEEPQYMCSICGRKFKQKDTLDTHMYTHSGIKRFVCSECPRRYTTNHALKLHVRAAHLNLPPPCACKLCSKRFRRMSVLNSHMQKEHGVRIVTRKMYFKRLPLLTDMAVEKAKVVLASDEDYIEDPLFSE